MSGQGADRDARDEHTIPWQEVVASERISQVRSRVAASGDPLAAAAEFWETVTATPLWEPDPEVAGAWRATFLWRGDPELTRHVTLCGGIVFAAFCGLPFEHVAGTDIWHLTLRVPPGTRSDYVLSPNGLLTTPDELGDFRRITATWMRDPLNPSALVIPANPSVPGYTPALLSVIEAPDAAPLRWSASQPDVAQGSLEEHVLESAALESTRRVYMYTPAGLDPGDCTACPLLVAFDGWEAVNVTRLPVVLDNLIAAGAIPPTVAVLIDAGTIELRDRDLDCHEPFRRFVAEDVVPFARKRWGLVPDRSQTVVTGVSLGGRAAVFAGLRRPDLFGKVVAQSTAVLEPGPAVSHFHKDDSGLDPLDVCAARAVEQPAERLEVYLDVGLLELDPTGGGFGFLPGVRHLRDVLRAAGHRVHYAELPYGHDAMDPGEALADGLQAMLRMGQPIRQSAS